MTALVGKTRLAVLGFALLLVLGLFEATRPKVLLSFELASAHSSRIPGVVAAIVGLVAAYVLLARGMDRRAGAYAVIVLATTPLWFVHARTLTGAIVPMAAAVTALAGLYIATVDDRATRALRVVAIVTTLAAGGILVRSHGTGIVASVLLGIAAAAWLREKRAAAAAIALFGAMVAIVTIVRGTPRTGAFDTPVTQAIYALAPWSPLAPFALVRRPRSPAQLAACVSAIAAIAMHAGLMPRECADAPLLAAPFVALAVGAMLRDLDDGERTSTLLAAAVFALGALVARDMGLAPERMLLGLGVHVEAAPRIPAVNGAANVVRVAMWIVVVTATGALLVSRGVLGLRTMRFARGGVLAAGGIVAGLVVRGGAWPAVLAGLSPRTAVETYVERRRPGEPLGEGGLDELAFTLPPHFSAGSYEIHWGAGVLPCTDDRRMRVTSGPHDAHDRIPLGRLEIR